jgi:hypothetical protein
MRFKNVLSELLTENVALLVENDNRDKIKKVFGLTDEWVNEFHRINPKMSIWIADSFLKDAVNNLDKNPKEVVEYLNKKGPNHSFWEMNYRANYAYIFDWFINVNTGGNLNLKNFTFRQALHASEQWHDSRGSNISSNYDEKNEIVIDYRENGIGFYWANLDTSYSKEEADRMGHCGNKHGTTLFSLRSINEDGDGQSFVTLARTPEGVVNEVHGKKNSKPKNVYQKYIIDFLLNRKYPVNRLTLQNVYKPDHNFQLDDLNPKELKHLFDNNREIKFNYVFGEDVKVIGKDIDNPEVALIKKGSVYGLANIDTVELIKPLKYTLLSDDELTDFIAINDDYYLIRHFNNDADSFLTIQEFVKVADDMNLNGSGRFKLISKDKAKELINNDTNTSLKDTKKKGK